MNRMTFRNFSPRINGAKKQFAIKANYKVHSMIGNITVVMAQAPTVPRGATTDAGANA